MPGPLDDLVQQTVRETLASPAQPRNPPTTAASPMDALVQATARQTLDAAPPGWPSPATQTAAVRERGGQLPRYEQLRRQPWFGQVDAEFRKAGISTYAWVKNALRESGGDPNAEGDRSKGGTATSFGLFQLHHGGLLDALTKRTKGDLNAAIALAKNPVEAAKIMAQEWKRQGLGNIKDERAQAYAFTRYLEKPAEEIARQVAAQLGQEHVPYQVHPKSPSYTGQPKTKSRTVGVEKAGQTVAKQQRAARLDALVGPRTFDAIHWDVAKPHPWSAGEQALAIFDENLRRAKYGMAREAIVEKTLGGEFPVFVLAADPKQRQYQLSALRALKWPVEDHFAELMKQYPGNRPVAANPWNPEPGYVPSADDAVAFKQAVTPKALQAVIEERSGRPLTNFQRAALPLISATLQARRDDAMQQGWRVMTGVAAKSAELAAGALPVAGVAGQALTRGGAAKAAAKAALSPKALGAAAASGAAYEAVSGLGQGDTPAEIAARTGVGAVGGVLGQAVLGTAGAAAFGALGFDPGAEAVRKGIQSKLGPAYDPAGLQRAARQQGGQAPGQPLGPGYDPALLPAAARNRGLRTSPPTPSDPNIPPGSLAPAADAGLRRRAATSAEPAPATGTPLVPAWARAAERKPRRAGPIPDAPQPIRGSVSSLGTSSPATVRVTGGLDQNKGQPGVVVQVGDPVQIVPPAGTPWIDAQVVEVLQNGNLRLGRRGVGLGPSGKPSSREFSPNEVFADPAEIAKLRPTQTRPAQTSSTAKPAVAHPAAAPAAAAPVKAAPAAKPSTVSSKPPVVDIDPNVTLNTTAAIARNVFVRAKTGGSARRGTLYGTPVSKQDGEYVLLDADDPITSHDIDGNLTPEYPPALQGRDRSDKDVRTQIYGIVNEFDPDELGGSFQMQGGMPGLGPDGLVESGNGRMLALREAYRRDPEGLGYKAWLSKNARAFGFDPEDVAKLERPVVVWRRKGELSDAERVVWAREANSDPKLAPKADEAARMDAEVVARSLQSPQGTQLARALEGAGDELPDGALSAWEELLPFGARVGLRDDKGKFTPAARGRLVQALVHYVFGDSPFSDALAFGGKGGIATLTRAARESIALLARLKATAAAKGDEGKAYGGVFLEALRDAAAEFKAAKESGRKPASGAQIVAAAFNEDDPDAVRLSMRNALLDLFSSRKADDIGDPIREYAERALSILNEGQASSGGLFDEADVAKPKAHALWESVTKKGVQRATVVETAGRQVAPDAPVGARTAAVPETEQNAALAGLVKELSLARKAASSAKGEFGGAGQGQVTVREVLGEAEKRGGFEWLKQRSDETGDQYRKRVADTLIRALPGSEFKSDATGSPARQDQFIGTTEGGATRTLVRLEYLPPSGGLIDEGSMTDEDAILNVVRMRNQSAEPPTLEQIADAVKVHGIPANRVPGIIAKLEAAGKIRKDGEGYRRGTLPAQSGGRPGTLEMAGRKPQQQAGLPIEESPELTALRQRVAAVKPEPLGAPIGDAADRASRKLQIEEWAGTLPAREEGGLTLARRVAIARGVDPEVAMQIPRAADEAWLFRAAELDPDPTEAVRKMLAGAAASDPGAAAARLAEKAVGNKTWGDILDEMEAAWKKADYSKIQDEVKRKGSENDRNTALRWLTGARETLERGPLSEGRKKDLLDLWRKHQNKLRQARYRAKAPDVLEQAGGRARRWFGSPLGNGAGRAVAIETHQIGGKTPRERFLGAMGQAFKMRPEQQQAYEAVMDAYTASWGKLTGRAPDEWYADRVKMVAQGRAGVAALGGRGALVSRSPRGAIRFEDTGQAIIAALHSPNLSTAVHEVAHIWRRDLYRALDEAADDAIKADVQANLLVLERAYGVMRDPSAAAGTPGMAPPKKWTPYQEERFAKDVERYFRDGLAPTGATPALKQALAKMKGWFSAIYRRLLGSPVERNISPDVREVLDTMFVGPAYAVQAREARARAKATAEMVLPPALRGKARRVTPGGRYWKVTVSESEAAGWAERHPEVWVPNGQPAIKDGRAEILFMLPERRVPDPKPGLETAKHWAARAVMPKGTVKAGDRPDPALFQQVAFVAGAVRTYAETMGRYGRELAAGMRNVDFTAEYNNGQHVDDIVTMFRGKSRKFIQEVVRYDRRRELLALPENRGKTMADLAPGTAPEVVAAADNLRSIMDDWLLRPAQELGIKRAGRQLLGGGSAVPRHWSPKGRAFLDDLLKDTNDDSWKGSPRVKAVIDHLIAGGIYKDVGAAEKGLLKYRASQMAKTMLRDPDYFASDRTLRGLPDEFFDDNLLDWIGTDLHGMHRYLAARQEWGNNIEVANALIEGLNAEPWHRDQLRKQIEVIYGGRPGVSRISEKLSRFNMGYQVASKLSGLVFPLVNLPQGIVSSTDWGLMNSLRAAAMALQRHRAPENQPELIRAVRRSGAVTDVFGDVGGSSWLARAARGPASWSETQGYYTVALAAARGLDMDLAVLRDIEAAKLSPDGKRLQAILRNLASMGSETEKKARYRLEHVLQMTPEEMAEAIATGGATPAQVARAMQFMVQDRMHRKTLSQQPPLDNTSALFKNAFLFRKFEVRQFLLLLNMAKRAVAMGEVRPLIQTTIAMGVAGAISQWVWSMGSGRGGRGTLIGEIVEGIQDDWQFDEKAVADRAGHAMALGGMPAMQLWSMDQKNVDTILRDAAWGVTGSSAKNVVTAAWETSRRPENWQEQGKELLTREFRLGREAARMTRWVANRDTDIRPELQELKDRMRLGQDKKVYQESNNPDSVLLRRMAGFLEVGNLEHALTIAMKYRDLNPEKDVKTALRSSMMARGPRGGLSEAKWNDLLDTLPGRKRAMAEAIDEQWKDRVLAVTGGL